MRYALCVMREMISIIIPIYNQAKKLKQCLESIKSQTYDNYELVIINDGSTDDFNKVMRGQAEIFGHKLSVIEQENKGAPSARNKGFGESKGEYIFFCDADAVLNPKILEIMLQSLKNNFLFLPLKLFSQKIRAYKIYTLSCFRDYINPNH